MRGPHPIADLLILLLMAAFIPWAIYSIYATTARDTFGSRRWGRR